MLSSLLLCLHLAGFVHWSGHNGVSPGKDEVVLYVNMTCLTQVARTK